jgi:hypothetical protein
MRSFLFLTLTLTLVFALLFNNPAIAQQFSGNPPSRKWNQINTDTARIIFSPNQEEQALRVASIIHHLARERPLSLGEQMRKINIVLQNQTTIPNGYVGLGPFRSEFFLTPDLNNISQGSIAWHEQLALHEYRHVEQFNNFNNGLSKLVRVISGEDGYSLAINAAVPDWFFEGDAVYQETKLSGQGRGRLPHFLNAYPSLWQAGKKYSWMKLRNGSLKDYVPNHYYLGFLLVNYGREKYGPAFWKEVTQDASAFKGLFYPFQRAVRKYAGVDFKTFRQQAFDYYKTKMGAVPATGDFIFPVKKKYVVNYYFPYRPGNDSLLYLKTTYRKRPAFYLKDNAGEHRLRIRDISIDEQFSYRNGKIVYAAFESDPRWGWKDYSVIRLLDITSGAQRTLRHKTKYFTPDISPNGSKVVAVLVDDSGKNELHVLNAEDGNLITAIKSEEIGLFTDPKFIDENRVVMAVRLKDGKMALGLAEVSSGNTMRLTNPSYNVIGYPSVDSSHVYFTASYGGNDDIFALQISDRKIFRITNGPLGNYYVNAAHGMLTWSAFTADGYQLKQMRMEDIRWDELKPELIESINERYNTGIDSGSLQVNNIPDETFPVTKYSKGTGLINFHSWRPYYSDPVFTYSIYGENILNTLQTELYYLYHQDEKTSAAGLNAVYGGLFPYISLGSEFTFDREEIIGNRIRRWNQLDNRVGLLVPLRVTNGRTFKNLSFGSNYILRNEFNKGFHKDSLGNTSFSYLLHTLSASQQVQRATQQVYPRFGWAGVLNHRHAITRFSGYQFVASGSIYLPGIMGNHNTVFTGAFQKRDTLGQVAFSNRFSYSRGYIGRYFSRMWRLSANYHFPLLYPDWGFGNILYLQSIRINAFYDFTKVYIRSIAGTRDQRSVGGELFVDTKWWNQYPLTFGVRISHLLDPDEFDGFRGTIFEFVVPVSIIPR